MAWCPECECEYVEGIRVCADCGCELTDKPVVKKSETELEVEEVMTALQQKAAAYENDEDVFEFEEPKEEKPYTHVYMNNEERAEENRTSAYTLLIVGSLGLVLDILFFMDVIQIHMTLVSKYMIGGVMGVMFVLFLVMGMVSMRNSKILQKKAGTENNLTQEIRKWCSINLSGEEIDSKLALDGFSEEAKYFQRFEKVKELIQNQFVNLDEAYLDRLIDELYPEVFEKA